MRVLMIFQDIEALPFIFSLFLAPSSALFTWQKQSIFKLMILRQI